MPLGVDTPEDLEKARALLARALTAQRAAQRNGTAMSKLKIAFQGEPGANSDIAAREAYPDCEPLPCATFEDALRGGAATARPTSA